MVAQKNFDKKIKTICATVINKNMERLTTNQNVDRFIKSISDNSVMSMERPKRIKELANEAVLNNSELKILNWICPRGTDLEYDNETKKVYRRFTETNPKDGFDTDYQILPRIKLEEELVRRFRRFSIPAVYYKAVADDNPPCLYPASLRIDGKSETMNAIGRYSNYAQNRFDDLLGKDAVWVLPWSDILGKEMFEESIRLFNEIKVQDLLAVLPKGSFELVKDSLIEHTKPDENAMKGFDRFAEDVTKYFAIEGYFLYEKWGDNVVLAWNDSTRKTKIIDSLRIIKGIPTLPKFFALHEKNGNKIANDY